MAAVRAALLREIPGKLEIDEAEVGSPGPHGVLLRTVAAGLCDPVGQVRDLADGIGVHDSFEAIGTKQTSEQAFGMLRSGGTCTVFAYDHGIVDPRPQGEAR